FTIAETTSPAYPVRPRRLSRGKPRRWRSAAAARLGAETDFLGQLAALLGVVRRHHGIIGGKLPALAVILRRHAVGGAQMALQHLQLLAVLEADDEIGRH